MKHIALIGGRGYTGAALLSIIAHHPSLSLAFASSNSQAGESIQSACADWSGTEAFIALTPETVHAHTADVWVLAVPNNTTKPWVDAIACAHPKAIIVDLSADHRFDKSWAYGLPEHRRATIAGSQRIANPGCYATAAQLALRPLLTELNGTPSIFGLSGYSGAGKTPSPKNDPARLRDNLQPYQLTGHVHESEISHQLNQRVRFMPHVAPFFSGISLTISITLKSETTEIELLDRFKAYYDNEPLINVCAEIPEVQNVQGKPIACIGGFTVNAEQPNEIVVVSTLDNLLKGAASQAMQNINLSLGFDEILGIL